MLSVSLLFYNCKKHKENKVDPDMEYYRFVNTETIQNDLVPLDMVRTEDQGFLFLGSSPEDEMLFHRTYLLKLDKEGKFLWDKYLEKEFLNPVSELMFRNGAYYIFCMDELTGTYLVKINHENGASESVKYFEDIRMPLHGSATPDGGFLVLSVNLGDKITEFRKLNSGLNLTWKEKSEFPYEDNSALNDKLNNHINHNLKPLPFFTGTVSGSNASYYFNGLSGTDFTTLFVNQATGKADGIMILGNKTNAAVRYLLPLDGYRFTMCRYDATGINYFTPSILITEVKASTEMGGQKFADMEPESRVLCRRHTIAGSDVIIYAANSRNKGVGLYAFEANSGAYLGSKVLSLESPCEMGGFAPTADGGIAVIAKTYVTNRFPRVLVFKLNEEETKRLVGK